MHTPEPAFEPTEPLHIRLPNRRDVLDRLRLGPRWYPVAQHCCERPYMVGQSRGGRVSDVHFGLATLHDQVGVIAGAKHRNEYHVAFLLKKASAWHVEW
jgi:hypothetical protein